MQHEVHQRTAAKLQPQAQVERGQWVLCAGVIGIMSASLLLWQLGIATAKLSEHEDITSNTNSSEGLALRSATLCHNSIGNIPMSPGTAPKGVQQPASHPIMLDAPGLEWAALPTAQHWANRSGHHENGKQPAQRYRYSGALSSATTGVHRYSSSGSSGSDVES